MKLIYLYLILVVSFVFFSYLFIDTNLLYLKYFYTGFYYDQKFLVSAMYILFISAFFSFYIYILRGKLSPFLIKKLIIFSLPLLLSYPAILSFDIFNYILTAKLTFFHFENPYTVMPIEILNEPLLKFTRAANKFALYGPAWILLTSIPFYLGFGIFLLTMFLFKLFAALFYFLLLKIIYLLTKSKKSVLFFALNPLVIIETFVSGHNDVVMMAFAFISFYLLIKRKIMLAFLFIILSILIKYATIALLPLFIIMVIKVMRREEINIEKIGKWGFYSMLIIFFLSPLREEIYPWYTIWLLSFAALSLKNKFVFYLSIALSFGVMFRYIPYMLLGTYFGITPMIKTTVTLIPVIFVLVYFVFKNKWLKS